MEKYYIYPVNESIGKLLEEMICKKTSGNYYIESEREAVKLQEVAEALQELGYISSFRRAPDISIPKNEEFKVLDI